ncbi:hypothetical protein [Colwellia piezophila]|uniref:hypothetical protein n=1 Tax=Colwellia piezophila TaxID=211668 RepID=UPI00036FC76B|nr:hypothetical protein [Colwellia piezophila]
MSAKLLGIFTLAIVINSIASVAFAHQKQQEKLDKMCEEARQVALKPRKKEIYQECLNKFKKSESVCKDEANAYNGNRINGAPMFYELPACEQAFAFRKKHSD